MREEDDVQQSAASRIQTGADKVHALRDEQLQRPQIISLNEFPLKSSGRRCSLSTSKVRNYVSKERQTFAGQHCL